MRHTFPGHRQNPCLATGLVGEYLVKVSFPEIDSRKASN